MSRREQIQMDEAEVAVFLEEQRTAILCSNDPDAAPHPAPMWFVVTDGVIRMTTYAKSHKVANLRADPRVSILLEDGSSYEVLRGVVLYGTVELVEGTDVVAGVMADVAARYSGQDAAAAEQMREALRPQAEKRIALHVRPDRVVSWDHRKLGGVY